MGTKACEDCYRLEHKQGLVCTKHVEERLARVTAERDTLRAEVEAMRAAITEVLSWKRTDMTALMSNPPQNAALVNAQRVLGDALRARKVGG